MSELSKQTKLGDIAQAVGGELTGDAEAAVVDVTHDSRQVKPGWLFVAIRGANVDGYRFVPQAARDGATGIISERARPAGFGGNWIRVADARRALAPAAAEAHGHPSREQQLVGITGTNGKTTTAYLVAGIAEAAGERVALLSTVEYRIAGERTPAEHTTPEASDVQRFLRRAVSEGCGVAVMEASSQAIDLHRCDSLHFAVAAFTNLTRDHLDYHGTMKNYFAAKRKLFDGSLGARPTVSAINVDDERGGELASELLAAQQKVISYGLGDGAVVTAEDTRFSMRGTYMRLVTPQGVRAFESPLVGRPHVYNILAAAACGLALDFSLDAIAGALEKGGGAPGRFERVPHTGDFAVVVDYAHTDDALLNVLRTARDVARGRVITVFGCGGDRDRTKRAPMGEIASRMSDIVIATSDNPRRENPLAILADVEIGLKATGKPYLKIPDRRAAIHHAIKEARLGDLVLIAGKGHEDYQIIGTKKIPFDDREVAAEALASLKARR